MIASMPMRSLVGDAEEVYRQIGDLAEHSAADEVMITTFLPEPADRRRTIVEMARVLGLSERSHENDANSRMAHSESTKP